MDSERGTRRINSFTTLMTVVGPHEGPKATLVDSERQSVSVGSDPGAVQLSSPEPVKRKVKGMARVNKFVKRCQGKRGNDEVFL